MSKRGNELIAVDDALTALAQIDPRKGRIIELRFFGGLGVEETTEALEVSPQTVLRNWKWRRPGSSASYASSLPRLTPCRRVRKRAGPNSKTLLPRTSDRSRVGMSEKCKPDTD
jgi:hypothetical protein